MAGSMISITAADGGTFESYYAAPRDGRGAGVVLIATILGIEPGMKEYADALAEQGFAATVPNMFWRDADSEALATDAEGYKRGHARNARSDIEQGMKDMADVIDDLKARPECNGKVAVMGFCFGGPYALLGAARLGIDAGISFHGSHVEDYLDEADRIACPMSFHYGDKDEVAPMEAIGRIKAAFDRLDDAELYVYPDVVHGYMLRSRGKGYDDAAAKASWERALKVLKAM